MTETRRDAPPSREAVDLLSRVELFEGLPEEDLRRVAGIVDYREVEADEVLFEEGEAGDAFYVVVEGSVAILKDRPGGGSERLAVRRAGDAFGEMALLNDAPRSATARAAEPGRLMVVARDDFTALLGGDTLAVRVMRILSRALRALGVRYSIAEGQSGAGTDPHEVSRLMQRGLLPRNAPRLPGYDIGAGTTTEETGRGRTVWDAVTLADGRPALLTLDVAEEGLPPGLHLAAARTAFRAVAAEHASPGTVLARVNDALAGAAVEALDQFVAAGLLTTDGEGLAWASAGRVPGGVIRRAGTFDELGSHGPPLGMMEGFQYGSRSVEMGSGDVVLVLSHGSQGLLWGAADLVAQLHGKPAGQVVSTLHRAIRKAAADEGAAEETSVLFVRKH